MRESRRTFLKASLFGLAGLALGCRSRLPDYDAPLRREPAPPFKDELRIVMLGDCGSGDLEQWQVAQAADRAAGEVGGFHAGAMLGDNFYPDGVDSITDPKWVEYFEQVYDTTWLGRLKWHTVLGNHDYSGNPRAQIEYSESSGGRWSMPWHYYRHDFKNFEGDTLLSLIALDTNKRSEQHERQLDWLKPTLGDLTDADWPVIAMGHHPMISNGRHDATDSIRDQILPALEGGNVQAYFAGHDHNMQVIQCPGLTHVVNGVGGKTLHGFTHDENGTLFRQQTFGFCILFATRSSLRLEFRDRQANVLFDHRIV